MISRWQTQSVYQKRRVVVWGSLVVSALALLVFVALRTTWVGVASATSLVVTSLVIVNAYVRGNQIINELQITDEIERTSEPPVELIDFESLRRTQFVPTVDRSPLEVSTQSRKRSPRPQPSFVPGDLRATTQRLTRKRSAGVRL